MISGTSSSFPGSPILASDKAVDLEIADLSTSDLWDAVVYEQLQREQQRKRMVRWRIQKKERMKVLNHERQKLERELRQCLAAAQGQTDTGCHQFESPALRTLREVVTVCATLNCENLALREALEHCVSFAVKLQRNVGEILQDSRPEQPSKGSTLHQDQLSRSVVYLNDEPSFYFQPFPRAKFDDVLQNHYDRMTKSHPCVATVGNIFGWTVDYAPLAVNPAGTACVAHAKFSRRLQCSLDDTARILPHLDKSTWPVIVTPKSWGHVQSDKASCQVLQSFASNANVVVCNIPGDVHLRYVAMAQHTRGKRSDSKRTDTYAIALVDPGASTEIHEFEESQNNVHWIGEGGILFTVTEVEESAVDVEYQHWTVCLSEAHGQELYIDWIRFAVLLEQYVSPARLLTI